MFFVDVGKWYKYETNELKSLLLRPQKELIWEKDYLNDIPTNK